MSQNIALISLMKKQWVTPLQALNRCGCLNFSGRICEIRRTLIGSGTQLESEWKQVGAKKVKAFRIIETYLR